MVPPFPFHALPVLFAKAFRKFPFCNTAKGYKNTVESNPVCATSYGSFYGNYLAAIRTMKGNPRLASKLADGVFPFIVLNSYLLCKKITHLQSVLQPTVIVFTKGSKNGTTTKRQAPPHYLHPVFSYAVITSLTKIILFFSFLICRRRHICI